MIPGSDSGGGIHDLTELHPAHHLVPGIQSRRDGGVPIRVSIGERPTRIAE